MTLKNAILKIHLYSGLICFWYLCVLGTSSLNFNHHFSFMQGGGEKISWSETISLTNNYPDDLLLSEMIRDSLSLIGWPLPWETWHDSTGVFHFALEQPAKSYVIDYSFDSQVAKVVESRKGFWPVFNSLHAGGMVPNAPFMYGWQWYSRIAVFLLIFSVLGGIYMWYRGRRDKKAGWYVLVIGLVVSLGWMLQLYIIG